MDISEVLPFIAGIASFIVAGGLVVWITKQPSGSKEMMDISNAVKEGASAFLKREMKIIVPVSIALAVIIGAAVNTDQVIPAGPNEGTYTPDDSTNTSNMAVSAFVLLLNVYGYYKMREEGVEEGMTFGGKDFGNKDDFFFKMYPAVTAVYVVLLLIANYVTQPL